ncbi:aminoglycoside 3'-phosphotransferase-2 [Aminobacter aminovorans]|uniref:Aminoglycoside 3'-phosphotransferase n=1 Tax=Aminobacter aminovorans TaxID=83263 RepID=A0A380WIS4_AMIAI|nr:APH(3') family aminoglycoside O-phosphotransferase [Aminobacter aminovorans]TCS29024.1 aminoglycoside 3'-phosphotransferase-2 [Aminobacter aminovorans]SUU88877.1 Aminoglycoside 3'-phosphotransferase [Aminobacter aminovorans]
MKQHAHSEMDIPASLREALAGYSWDRQTIGHSDAGVFKLTANGKPVLFLKTELSGKFAELPDEVARLRWLGNQGIPCPEVFVFETHAGHHWLLMTAVAGRDLVSQEMAPDKAIAIMADALRRLHALDVATCPFDHRLGQRIAVAKARAEAGEVDEYDFDDERLGQTAQQVFGELLARRPASETLVVTHGDASMPNFVADGGRFTGFVDCSRLGVADLHQDLALACWSIHFNLGEEWIEPFLALYGLPEADAAKLSYYQLLDEFF